MHSLWGWRGACPVQLHYHLKRRAPQKLPDWEEGVAEEGRRGIIQTISSGWGAWQNVSGNEEYQSAVEKFQDENGSDGVGEGFCLWVIVPSWPELEIKGDKVGNIVKTVAEIIVAEGKWGEPVKCEQGYSRINSICANQPPIQSQILPLEAKASQRRQGKLGKATGISMQSHQYWRGGGQGESLPEEVKLKHA